MRRDDDVRAGSGRDNTRRVVELDAPRYTPAIVLRGFDEEAFSARMHEKDPAKVRRIADLLGELPDDIRIHGRFEDRPQNLQVEEPAGARSWTDAWGTGWRDLGAGAFTVSHPLEEGYDRLGDYRWPDFTSAEHYASADPGRIENEGRYRIGRVWFTLFERLWMLRGFENALMDPYTEPEGFLRLKHRIVETRLASIDRWLEHGVDAIFFSDDWGSQQSLLIDPDEWRRLFLPDYVRLFRRVRDGGAHVWMHLCGNVSAIIPDLIDAGLNVLNPVQPQAMDVEELAERYAGRLCFYGGVDVQGYLIRETPEYVKEKVERLFTLFGADGGYLAGPSHAIMPETPLDNIIAMLEVFAEHAAGEGRT